MLAAYTTVLWGGDLLIILSDIEGIYNKNPQDYKDAKLIEIIEDIEGIENSISLDGKSSFGTGGIATKILAAKEVSKYGANTIVAKGKKENILLKLLNGEAKGTLFLST